MNRKHLAMFGEEVEKGCKYVEIYPNKEE